MPALAIASSFKRFRCQRRGIEWADNGFRDLDAFGVRAIEPNDERALRLSHGSDRREAACRFYIEGISVMLLTWATIVFEE